MFWQALHRLHGGRRRADDSERSQIGWERESCWSCARCQKAPKFAGARKSSLLPSQSSTLLPFAHTHTLSNLPRQTHTNTSATFETSAIELLLLSSQFVDRNLFRHSHRISQYKAWLSNSRARLPSCSTRPRSMPQRLPPTRKRMARTASTLAADLRRPVVILRDTVSLPLSAALFFFFPLPLHGRTRLPAEHYCMHQHHSHTILPHHRQPLAHTHAISLFLPLFLLRNQLGCNTLQSNPPQHMRQPTPRAVTFQQGLCNG